MLTGGAMLLVPAFVLRDTQKVAWFALSLRPLAGFAFLVVFASLLAFTSYVWLIKREPLSKVASYAYVNPVIAVLVGHFLGAEPLTVRTLVGSGLVVVAVFSVMWQGHAPATARTTPSQIETAAESS
jgi:drug/metabolite transporter (DMT)-like permease